MFSVCVIEHKYYTTHNVPVHFTDIDGTETKPLSNVCECVSEWVKRECVTRYVVKLYISVTLKEAKLYNSSCLIREVK